MAPSKSNRWKTEKACKAMKTYGISKETVKSTLKRLLEVYDNSWLYIEEDNYRVLTEAIFEPEGPKAVDTVKHDLKLRDESEDEADPLMKKPRLSSQIISSTPAGTCIPCSSKYAFEMQQTVETDIGTMDVFEDRQYEGMNPVPQFPDPLLVIQPAPPMHLCEDDFSSKSLVDGNKLLALEYNNMDTKENENVDASPCSSEIEIASSSNGEVKLTFSICKPPQGFCIPSLDEVMTQVEDMYRERFQVLGTEFSLSGILKDIFQCFIEQGDGSDGNNQDMLLNFGNLKEPEKQGDQLSLSNALVAPDDHTDTPIPIPKFVVSSPFNHVRCVNILNSDGCHISETNRKYQMLVIDDISGSSSLTILPKEGLSLALSSSHYLVPDITRGFEKQQISLINEFNDEMPPAFTYIQNNVNYKTASVKFMLARISNENCCSNCFGDCLSPEVPCACAAETGGEFAYTMEGSLKKEFLESYITVSLNPTKGNYFFCDNCPLERMKRTTESGSCSGHLVRKFIKECWCKCGCGLNCGNRVVQRGIQANLQVFMTPEGKGWGLRTLEDLSEGTFVCEYIGEIVTNSELFDRKEHNKDDKHTYPVLLDADWGSEDLLKDEETLCLDATSFGNVARFINHRCEDANMVAVPVEVESPDHHYYHHAFFTARKVKAMEELTWMIIAIQSRHSNVYAEVNYVGRSNTKGELDVAYDKHVTARRKQESEEWLTSNPVNYSLKLLVVC